jgi:hypothetical protein
MLTYCHNLQTTTWHVGHTSRKWIAILLVVENAFDYALDCTNTEN